MASIRPWLSTKKGMEMVVRYPVLLCHPALGDDISLIEKVCSSITACLTQIDQMTIFVFAHCSAPHVELLLWIILFSL